MLDRISPLAVPVILEIARERIDGSATDELLAAAADDDELVAEAMPELTRPGTEQGRLAP